MRAPRAPPAVKVGSALRALRARCVFLCFFVFSPSYFLRDFSRKLYTTKVPQRGRMLPFFVFFVFSSLKFYFKKLVRFLKGKRVSSRKNLVVSSKENVCLFMNFWSFP